MRTLSFIVDGQIIKQNPECDFNNIVPGTSGYLIAEFIFSSEWKDTVKVATFWRNGNECPPQVLNRRKKLCYSSRSSNWKTIQSWSIR